MRNNPFGIIKNFATLLLLLLMGFNSSAQHASGEFKIKTGDLLFQDLDCGPLCDAIEKVTRGHQNSTFSHVGIAIVKPDKSIEILEAIGDSVRQTPLEKFLSRTKDAHGNPKVAVGRIHSTYQKLIPTYITTASTYRGKPYDAVFAIDNDSYYCSELVYLAYADKSGKPLFNLNPMTYKDPKTMQIFQPWQDYFDSMGTVIPEGEPGINPGGISQSEKLTMFYPYGKPDKLTE